MKEAQSLGKILPPGAVLWLLACLGAEAAGIKLRQDARKSVRDVSTWLNIVAMLFVFVQNIQ